VKHSDEIYTRHWKALKARLFNFRSFFCHVNNETAINKYRAQISGFYGCHRTNLVQSNEAWREDLDALVECLQIEFTPN
jgi:hypothetical protein